MDQTGFLIVAVIVGSTVLGTVLWRYIRLTSQGEVALSTTLALIGFILLSTPLWASIAIKGPEWEVSLLKEQSKEQAQQYLALLEAYQKALPKAQAEKVSPAVTELRGTLEKTDEVKNKAQEIKRMQEIGKKISDITSTVIKLVNH